MRNLKFVIFLMTTVFAIVSIASCSLTNGPGADYTVRGKQSVYVEEDTRVFVNTPVFSGLSDDGIHDRENDSIRQLQEPEVAMRDFPADRRGGINWVTAIDKGIVNPRMSLKGDESMNMMDMDILFKDTAEMPWVRFPHLAHTRWLDCSNCHPAIFVPQKGGNPKIGMDAIIAGKYCGRCHDKVAFALWTCERCHSVPHEGSPKAWWRNSDNPYPASEQEAQRVH